MASMKQNDSDYLILNEEWGKKSYKPLTQRVYACDSFTNEIYCALKLLGKWDICSYKLFILFRADCSEADIPGNSPVHNGLTQFGRVSSSDYNVVRIREINLHIIYWLMSYNKRIIDQNIFIYLVIMINQIAIVRFLLYKLQTLFIDLKMNVCHE